MDESVRCLVLSVRQCFGGALLTTNNNKPVYLANKAADTSKRLAEEKDSKELAAS